MQRELIHLTLNELLALHTNYVVVADFEASRSGSYIKTLLTSTQFQHIENLIKEKINKIKFPQELPY